MEQERHEPMQMYTPEVHYAKARVQRDIENYLHDSTSFKVVKDHNQKDFFREADVYTYTLFDQEGNEVGKITYSWGNGNSAIEYDISNEKFLKKIQKEFGDGSERLKKYEDIWNGPFDERDLDERRVWITDPGFGDKPIQIDDPDEYRNWIGNPGKDGICYSNKLERELQNA